MDRTKIGLLSESLAALLIGSLLYMLARPANLVAFDWLLFDTQGFDSEILWRRNSRVKKSSTIFP